MHHNAKLEQNECPMPFSAELGNYYLLRQSSSTRNDEGPLQKGQPL
jgi:hypothetical protein